MELDLIAQLIEPPSLANGGGGGGGGSGSDILLEDGSGHTQLEDGSGSIELETGP